MKHMSKRAVWELREERPVSREVMSEAAEKNKCMTPAVGWSGVTIQRFDITHDVDSDL